MAVGAGRDPFTFTLAGRKIFDRLVDPQAMVDQLNSDYPLVCATDLDDQDWEAACQQRVEQRRSFRGRTLSAIQTNRDISVRVAQLVPIPDVRVNGLLDGRVANSELAKPQAVEASSGAEARTVAYSINWFES